MLTSWRMPRSDVPELERFVMVHRAWGELVADLGEMTERGYSLRLACSCGAAFPGRVRACPLTFPHKSRTLEGESRVSRRAEAPSGSPRCAWPHHR